MNSDKRYKEALEKASIAYKDEDKHLKATLERIFPELKESENESIKKDLMGWLEEFPDMIWKGHYKKDVLAWLEKQCEQKAIDNDEPRFNEGEWIVDDYGYVWRIEGIQNQCYLLVGDDGCESLPTIEWVDKTSRLWTIQNAKDGDVLSGEIDGDKYIFSFKKLNGRWIETQGVCYCETTGKCIENARFCNHYQDFFKPASKEECDLLLLKTTNHQWK